MESRMLMLWDAAVQQPRCMSQAEIADLYRPERLRRLRAEQTATVGAVYDDLALALCARDIPSVEYCGDQKTYLQAMEAAYGTARAGLANPALSPEAIWSYAATWPAAPAGGAQ